MVPNTPSFADANQRSQRTGRISRIPHFRRTNAESRAFELIKTNPKAGHPRAEQNRQNEAKPRSLRATPRRPKIREDENFFVFGFATDWRTGRRLQPNRTVLLYNVA